MEEQRRKAMKQMALYNHLLKELDDIYRVYAKNCNLSETAFWILYCIREREETFTQREICNCGLYAADGEFSPKTYGRGWLLGTSCRRRQPQNKKIYLTEKGESWWNRSWIL